MNNEELKNENNELRKEVEELRKEIKEIKEILDGINWQNRRIIGKLEGSRIF